MDVNSDTCRLCLLNDAVVSIFGNKSSDVSHMIKRCCQFEIVKEDNLPQKLCLKCMDTLKICHEFILQCVENNHLLQLHNEMKQNGEIVKVEQKYFIKCEFENAFDEDNYDNNSINAETSFCDHNDDNLDLKDEDEEDDIKPVVNKEQIENNNSSKKRKRSTVIKRNRNVKVQNEKEKKKSSKKKKRKEPRAKSPPIDKSEKVLCDLCGKAIIRANINLHKRRHTSEKNISCELCPKKFKVRDSLMRHIISMHKDTSVTCDICKNVYSNRLCLRNHIANVHSTERNHACEVCNKKFKGKYFLSLHMRTHTQERPYQCRFCDSTFALSKSKTDHERLHMGITPYKCPLCPKAFTQLSNMKSHFKHNHKDIVFSEVYKPPPKEKKILIATNTKTGKAGNVDTTDNHVDK